MKDFLPRRLRAILPMLAFLVVGACAQYDYVPPPTPEGQSCVAQCRMMRSQCQSQQDSQLQQCNVMRSSALTAYNRCRSSGGGSNCVQPPICTSSSYRCSSAFDECFRSCGGRIVQTD